VTLGSNVNLQAALTLLHNALAGERNAFADVQSASLALAEELQDRTCLIVIDDVWDSSHLQPFLRGGRNCTRLITTRNFRVAADFAHVKVDEMRGMEATSLLVRGLPAADLRAFEETARRLGEWPLLHATLRSFQSDAEAGITQRRAATNRTNRIRGVISNCIQHKPFCRRRRRRPGQYNVNLRIAKGAPTKTPQTLTAAVNPKCGPQLRG